MAKRTRTSAVLTVLVVLLGMTVVSALAQPGGTQVAGMVQSIASDTITLADGTSFPITDQTRVTQITYGTAADLAPGMFVAISAGRRSDGDLVASLIYPFAAGATPSEGQRELAETRFCEPGCQTGDLMTNAQIDDAVVDAISGGELTISFAGATARVHLTSGTRVEIQNLGSLADVVPGANVLGFLAPTGVASGVWVYLD